MRGSSSGWLVGILHLNKRGPICSPGEHSLFSAVWFAFSHPPPTSAPPKRRLYRDVLTVMLPLCQSCVAGIAPSVNQAVLGHLCDALGFSIGLDPRVGVKGFFPGVCIGGGHGRVQGSPVQKLPASSFHSWDKCLVLSAETKA